MNHNTVSIYITICIFFLQKKIIKAYLQYSWQHTLINAEHLKGSAFNAEVLLGVVNHGLMISFITLTCTDGQQLNKQYDHNDFQVDVPDSIGVSKITLSMYVWFVTPVTLFSGNIYIINFLFYKMQCSNVLIILKLN